MTTPLKKRQKPSEVITERAKELWMQEPMSNCGNDLIDCLARNLAKQAAFADAILEYLDSQAPSPKAQ